jgi:hypothetical protein
MATPDRAPNHLNSNTRAKSVNEFETIFVIKCLPDLKKIVTFLDMLYLHESHF